MRHPARPRDSFLAAIKAVEAPIFGTRPRSVAGGAVLTRLVGRVHLTLHLWTPPPSNMPKEVLEAFSLTANCVFAVMEERKHALFRARIRGFKSHRARHLPSM